MGLEIMPIEMLKQEIDTLPFTKDYINSIARGRHKFVIIQGKGQSANVVDWAGTKAKAKKIINDLNARHWCE